MNIKNLRTRNHMLMSLSTEEALDLIGQLTEQVRNRVRGVNADCSFVITTYRELDEPMHGATHQAASITFEILRDEDL